MSSFCTPAYGVNVWTISIDPEVKGMVPAIKVYLNRRWSTWGKRGEKISFIIDSRTIYLHIHTSGARAANGLLISVF